MLEMKKDTQAVKEEIEKKRIKNERKFSHWEKLPNGGRKYWYEITGKSGYKARYIKEVNKKEETVKFYQEIYDNNGNLVEIHKKFPVDLGHQPIRRKR